MLAAIPEHGTGSSMSTPLKLKRRGTIIPQNNTPDMPTLGKSPGLGIEREGIRMQSTLIMKSKESTEEEEDDY